MTTTAAHHEDQMTTTRFATSADGTRIAYEVQDAVPDGRVETLPGQTHMIKAKVTAPVVAAHLLSTSSHR